MRTYFLKFDWFHDVVKLEGKKLTILKGFEGNTLGRTPFIDKLIIDENKSYPKECIEIVEQVERFYRNYAKTKHEVQRETIAALKSLESSRL